jgi:hypothetical protein
MKAHAGMRLANASLLVVFEELGSRTPDDVDLVH